MNIEDIEKSAEFYLDKSAHFEGPLSVAAVLKLCRVAKAAKELLEAEDECEGTPCGGLVETPRYRAAREEWRASLRDLEQP